MTVTQELLKELFEYKDGNLYWIKKPSKKSPIVVGEKAGYKRPTGYIAIGINKKMYLVHRLVYLYHFGTFPNVLDHIDGNPSNNCIENLREATHRENSLNSRIRYDNTSGYKNVSWHKLRKKWYVQMKVNGKPTPIGYYDDVELANKAAIMAREKYHGIFANHK